MRLIFRIIFNFFYLLFFWPISFYKKFGNKNKIRIKSTIVVSNHYGDFDTFILKMLLIKNKVRFVATSDVKQNIITRFFCWGFNCLYVGEDLKTNRKFFKEAIDYLNKGGNIVIFPEGVVNPMRFGFLDFHEGYIALQEKTKADILPIFIDSNAAFFKRSKIYVGDVIKDNDVLNKNRTEKNMFVLSKLMDYSFKINEEN